MRSQVTILANDFSAFVPTIWAQESLRLLEANTVMLQLVNRDFDNRIASYGETVTTRRPSTFVMKRKVKADDVTVQDASADPVSVVLDQHNHVSFIIKDEEASKSIKDLFREYLEPAIKAMAAGIDQVLTYQLYDFLLDRSNNANVLGRLGTALDWATIVSIRERMNTLKMPMDGRNMVITPNAEGDLLNIKEFVNAEKVGDAGTVLREGSMGRRMGINFFMCQQTPSVALTASHIEANAMNAAGAVGDTSVVFKNEPTVDPLVGEWITIAGDDTPQLVTAWVDGTNTATIHPGLQRAVSADAVIRTFKSQAVNGDHALGYNKAVAYNAATITPKVGQMLSHGGVGTTKQCYGCLSTPTVTAALLNRSLDAAWTNADVLGLGPAGDYCFAFHRDALTFVSRPLATPQAGTGALSYVANYNGLGIRVTITYNGLSQGHLITVDLLAGIKTLDRDLGVVVVR